MDVHHYAQWRHGVVAHFQPAVNDSLDQQLQPFGDPEMTIVIISFDPAPYLKHL